MVVPVESGLSPTKGELVYSRGGYSKRGKEGLEGIPGSRGGGRGVMVWLQVWTPVVPLVIVIV